MVSKADGKFRVFENSKLSLIDRMASSEAAANDTVLTASSKINRLSGVRCDTDL